MLHHDCEKLDPRVRRTRGLLQDALRKLLEQKEFDRISVQDITRGCDSQPGYLLCPLCRQIRTIGRNDPRQLPETPGAAKRAI